MLLRSFTLMTTLLLAACASDDAGVEVICQLESCPELAGTSEFSDGSPKSVTIPATSDGSGGLSGGLITADFDTASQIFTVSALGLNAQMNRFPTADFGRFLAMRDAGGVHNAYLAQGSGTKVVIYSGGNAGSVLNLASFGRIGATELPLVGSAQFLGDYAGFTTTRRINGKSRIDVDFANAKVSGSITDRIFR